MSIKLFGFYTFYAFFGFWHKSSKRLIKNNNVKSFKAKANKYSTQKCVLKTRIINLRQINKAHITQEIQGIVPTPMVLRSDSNHGPSRGLVKMSAFWLSIWMNSRQTTLSSTKSQMKWYCISMCLDLECWTGFLERYMALVLSQKTHIVYCGIL